MVRKEKFTRSFTFSTQGTQKPEDLTKKVSKLHSTLLDLWSLSSATAERAAWAEKVQWRILPTLFRRCWVIPLVPYYSSWLAPLLWCVTALTLKLLNICLFGTVRVYGLFVLFVGSIQCECGSWSRVARFSCCLYNIHTYRKFWMFAHSEIWLWWRWGSLLCSLVLLLVFTRTLTW